MNAVSIKYDHLVGRQYEASEANCYQLARAFFDDNFGLKLTDYAIPSDWDSDVVDLLEQLHEREGFEKIADWRIKDLRPGDVLCTAVGSKAPNHIVINLGGNLVLHHLRGRLSAAEPLRDYWRMVTCFLLRHPAVPDLRPVPPLIPLEEVLRVRYPHQ